MSLAKGTPAHLRMIEGKVIAATALLASFLSNPKSHRKCSVLALHQLAGFTRICALTDTRPLFGQVRHLGNWQMRHQTGLSQRSVTHQYHASIISPVVSPVSMSAALPMSMPVTSS